jgi:hypothetical protein
MGKIVGFTVLKFTTQQDEVKQRVQLYLYSLFGPSWPVLG